MIQGVVNAAYEAVVPLSLQGPARQAQDVEAVWWTPATAAS